MKKYINLQLFAAAENTTVTTDLEPGISIDCVSKLTGNIDELKKVLGITDMEVMNAGTTIKIYKLEQVNTPAQVGEGEEITLTKVTRKVARTVELALNKYRRNTTAEAIQKVGRNAAINQTDAVVVTNIQKDIKKLFYDILLTGTGVATGTTLQSTMAAVWGKMQETFEDTDATPIYWASTQDVAEYLGNAQLTMQQTFGMSYVIDFIGLGTLIVSPRIPKGKVVGTAKENLRGAYIPANTGDVAKTFGLTSDSTGFVGMAHFPVSGNATVDTLLMSGVVFYPELLDGVIVGTITGA